VCTVFTFHCYQRTTVPLLVNGFHHCLYCIAVAARKLMLRTYSYVVLQVAQQMIRAVLREDNDYSSQRIRYYRRIISHNVPLRHHYPPSIIATPATAATATTKANSSKASTAATATAAATSDNSKQVPRQVQGARVRARWLIITDTRLFLLQASCCENCDHSYLIENVHKIALELSYINVMVKSINSMLHAIAHSQTDTVHHCTTTWSNTLLCITTQRCKNRKSTVGHVIKI
jgi:hypothetical protein